MDQAERPGSAAAAASCTIYDGNWKAQMENGLRTATDVSPVHRELPRQPPGRRHAEGAKAADATNIRAKSGGRRSTVDEWPCITAVDQKCWNPQRCARSDLEPARGSSPSVRAGDRADFIVSQTHNLCCLLSQRVFLT